MRYSALLAAAVVLIACGSAETDPETSVPPDFADTSASGTSDELRTLPDSSDLGLPTTQIKEDGKLYPVDEAPRDPSLVAFRQNLLGVIARRDPSALLSALSPDVGLGFSGESGREAFEEQWDLKTNPKASDIWRVMNDVLRGGGVWQEGPDGNAWFSAPYVFSTYDGRDAFEQSVITGAGVNVRAEPRTGATILTQLSYDIVDLATPPANAGTPLRIGGYDYGWTAIELPGGKRGFVSDKYITSPVGYRVIIEQTNGKWQINNLVVGD